MELSVTNKKFEINKLLNEAYEIRINSLKESIDLSEQALDLGKAIDHEPSIARSLSLLSLFHMIMGDFDLSISMANEAIDHYKNLADEKGIADAKYTIAGAYYKRDDFYRGLSYLLECHTTYTKLGDHHNLSRVQKSMGTIFEYLGDIDKAVEAYENAIGSARKDGDINLESNAVNPLSGIHLNRGDIQKAMEIITYSITLKEKSGDTRGLAFALYGRGKVYTQTKEFDLAEKDFRESIKIHEEMGERLGLAMSHHKLGALYLAKGDLKNAKKVLIEALEYSNKNKIILIKFKSNLLLHEVAKKEGDFELALKYMTQYIEEKESVVNVRTAKVIEGYSSLNRMQTLEQELKAEKQKTDLEINKNIELDSFFYRVSHDLKGPIASMSSLSYLAKLEVTDEKALKFINEYDQNVHRLNNILTELLNLARITYSSETKEEINFRKLVDECIASFKYLENFEKISFDVKVEEIAFKAEWSLVNSILQNLIENGIKYARIEDNESQISVQASQHNQDLIIKISDNGIGMVKEDVEKVFKMFFRANRKIDGTGLGLHIVKRAVDQLNGKIEVESEINKGTTFTVQLPLNYI